MDYYRIANSLLAQTAATRTRWYGLAKQVYPRLIPASRNAENEANADGERICYKARKACLTLASAHMEYITPMGQKWFQFCSWQDDKASADEKSWYTKASSIAQHEIEASNFYTEMNAVYIDRVITGTGLMMIEGKEEDGSLVFEHIPAGTYALSQNASHEVNAVVRVLRMKASEILEKWKDEDVLTPSMRSSLNDDNRRYTEEFEVWHLVCPRFGGIHTVEMTDAAFRPFVSVFIDPKSRSVLHEDGCYEFPFLCTRFLRSGAQVYGDSALAGLEDIMRDREILSEVMMVAGQKVAFPPIVALGENADEIDMRGGGVTIVSAEAAQAGFPRALVPGGGGEYRVGLDMLERLDKEIEQALFIDMLLTVSSVDRQMTATEVTSRESERVMSFSASFMQHVSDCRPSMNRVFCLLMRAGKLGDLRDAPDGLLREVYLNEDASRKALTLSPKVAYVGKMSQALAQAQTGTVMSLVQRGLELMAATGDPAWTDKFNPDKVVEELVRNANIPFSVLRTEGEVKKVRAEREAAMRAAQEAENAAKVGQARQSNANAAATLSQIPRR